MYNPKYSHWATRVHASPVVTLKTLFSRGFLTLRLGRRCHRCGWSYHHPNGFHEELQVLGSESWSCRSVNILDILSTWSSADLHNVAWFATVEAETMTRVPLHWVSAIQVHGLGDWRCSGSRGLGVRG